MLFCFDNEASPADKQYILSNMLRFSGSLHKISQISSQQWNMKGWGYNGGQWPSQRHHCQRMQCTRRSCLSQSSLESSWKTAWGWCDAQKSIAYTYDIYMSARNEWVSVCSCEGERANQAKHEAKIKLANAHCSTYIIRFCIPVILLALKLQKLRQCLVYVNGHWILRWSLMVPMRRNER